MASRSVEASAPAGQLELEPRAAGETQTSFRASRDNHRSDWK
jgi:hypothetical protein